MCFFLYTCCQNTWVFAACVSQGFPFFETSASSGAGVRPLFATLFARMLATIPGIPQDLASQAVHTATTLREEEGV